MQRVLEPEVMDGEEQALAYARADFASVNAAFVARLRDTFPHLAQGRAVDLGCGPADILVRLCGALPGLRAWGLDASAPMLALGREAVAQAGLQGRVSLCEAWLPDLGGLSERGFDAVISNSLLHHLPDPAALWSSARALGRPGAALLVVDLLRPQTHDEARAIVEAYSGAEPDVLKHDFYHSLLAAFRVDEVQAQLRAHGLDALQVEAISDRHWAAWGRLP